VVNFVTQLGARTLRPNRSSPTSSGVGAQVRTVFPVCAVTMRQPVGAEGGARQVESSLPAQDRDLIPADSGGIRRCGRSCSVMDAVTMLDDRRAP